MADTQPLPEPPEAPTPLDLSRAPEPKKSAGRGWLVFAISVLVILGIVFGARAFLAEPSPTPNPKPAPAPAARASLCAHETFEANGCANQLLDYVAAQSETTPNVAIQVLCSQWQDPKARRHTIRMWVRGGAYPSEARAVMAEIRSFCPPEAA